MKIIKQARQHPFFIKLLNWEYWPFHVLYAPLYFYWIWLCVKSRSLFFFNASNPGIKNGGFLMESKKEIYDLMPREYYPATLFFYAGTSIHYILNKMEKAQLHFPLIGKPDIGMRGLAVKKLDTMADVIAYAKSSTVNFLLQEFVEYENEVGIFYYRMPGDLYGHISGIVAKEFLQVEGDGKSTILSLLKKDDRYILQIPTLKKSMGAQLYSVPEMNEKKLLVPYGNHCRGARFIDASHLIDGELTRTIDAVCKQVEGFYFGRLDVRYNTWEELIQGTFSIIELNGAGSEPTHIYDPVHSVFYAWKEITRHWKILFEISRINHLKKKVPYMNLKQGVDMFSQNNAYVKMISEDLKRTA